jgi:GNAT superfamily N-acetyltransferase
MTTVTASPTEFTRIRWWRDMYRLEMSCQIIHDSLHDRDGWTQEYLLTIGETAVGYGSLAKGGPWSGRPALYEWYVVPTQRTLMFELFQALMKASHPVDIEVQSNDPLATVMLHTFAQDVTSESILFEDALLTDYQPLGAIFRAPTPSEAPDEAAEDLRWCGVVELDGKLAASGGILFHYNRPYGDIYMEVNEAFRGRGLGSFVVQELKRVCYEGGHVPAARCNPNNVGSRRALQKAGFVPCGHILKGALSQSAPGPTSFAVDVGHT